MSELHIVSVSGGKDSTALYLWAIEKFGPDGFRAVFSDTGSEAPVTLNYLRNLPRLAGGPEIDWVKADFSKALSKKAITPTGVPFTDMLLDMNFMPSGKRQFCSTYLKLEPIRNWLEDIRGNADVFMYVGIRAEESLRRAQMREVEWSDFFDCEVRRPLLTWKVGDVFDLLNRYGVEPNPLYAAGFSRVGCFPCIHANRQDLARLPEWAWERLAEWEKVTGLNWFPPGKGGDFSATIKSVREWANAGRDEFEVAGPVPACLGHWVCE